MATNYNGVREKELNQINTQEGKACVACSAPDFFLDGQNLFAPKRAGNSVRFFTTGEDYFKDVATAIDQASNSIFITGWQVNYDVLLDGMAMPAPGAQARGVAKGIRHAVAQPFGQRGHL